MTLGASVGRLDLAGPFDRPSHLGASGMALSRNGKATTAAGALEHALISRFGTLGRFSRKFLLRSAIGIRHQARTDGA